MRWSHVERLHDLEAQLQPNEADVEELMNNKAWLAFQQRTARTLYDYQARLEVESNILDIRYLQGCIRSMKLILGMDDHEKTRIRDILCMKNVENLADGLDSVQQTRSEESLREVFSQLKEQPDDSGISGTEPG